jgi:hypothetical protein
MNTHAVKTAWFHVFILEAVAFAVLLLHPVLLQAETDACALLKAADVAPLLGGTPVSKGSPEGATCTWTRANANRKLLIIAYKNKNIPGDMAFMGARHGAEAEEGSKVSDETGIGDKAFSAQTAFGAVFIVLKQGRMLQLQYWTKVQGTSQDVAALRPVVKKAVAAL